MAPNIKNVRPTWVESAPASAKWGSNIDAIIPLPKKQTKRSKNGRNIAGD